MTVTLQNRDITLLVIAAAGSAGLTPVQLQKTVFLVGQSRFPEFPPNFYPFYAYNYGPFHPDVYRDAEALEAEGLVVEVQIPNQSWSKYVVTPAGDARANEFLNQVSTEFSTHIGNIVAWAKGLSFNELLRAIYAKYPDFRANSVFQG